MERKELLSKWDAFCNKFVPQVPSGYSPEDYLFDVAKTDFPVEVKKNAPEDSLEQLKSHDSILKLDDGALVCSAEKIQELTDFLKQDSVQMAFNYTIGKDDPVHVVKDYAFIKERDVWFIGDIHGDIMALKSSIAFVNSNSKKKPIYVLLGDLFDRNEFGLNVVLEVVGLMKNQPDSVFMVAGNHDEGLSYNGKSFSSNISPCQYTDLLNILDDAQINQFMIEFTNMVKKLPSGLVLPNGILATHGGVPSRIERSVKNIWDGLDTKAIKQRIVDCRREFQMNRFVGDTLGGSKMHPEFSWAEIINFSIAIEKVYGVPIKTLVRGHDHCNLSRHEWSFSTFKGNDSCADADRVRYVLTMTSMVLMDESEKKMSGFGKREISFPTVACCVVDSHLPKVYSLEMNLEEVKTFYARAYEIQGRENLGYVEKHIVTLENESSLSDFHKKEIEANCLAKKLEIEKKESLLNEALEKSVDESQKTESANKDFDFAKSALDKAKADLKELNEKLDCCLKTMEAEKERESDLIEQIRCAEEEKTRLQNRGFSPEENESLLKRLKNLRNYLKKDKKKNTDDEDRNKMLVLELEKSINHQDLIKLQCEKELDEKMKKITDLEIARDVIQNDLEVAKQFVVEKQNDCNLKERFLKECLEFRNNADEDYRKLKMELEALKSEQDACEKDAQRANAKILEIQNSLKACTAAKIKFDKWSNGLI